MSYTDDELETALQLMSSKIASMFMQFQKETRHAVVAVDLSSDEAGNLGVACRLELVGSVYIKNGNLDS
jgi:hypothetical protein